MLIDSQALADPADGVRVDTADGRISTTDGPFAEAKEYLAGFYLVDVPTRERAIELAARAPEAVHGGVEVRPIQDLSMLAP